jgi:hypothetical protein
MDGFSIKPDEFRAIGSIPGSLLLATMDAIRCCRKKIYLRFSLARSFRSGGKLPHCNQIRSDQEERAQIGPNFNPKSSTACKNIASNPSRSLTQEPRAF